MITEAQARATRNYDASNTRGYRIRLLAETDADVLERIASEPSRQGYLKRLIAQDVASGSVADTSTRRVTGTEGDKVVQVALKLNVHTDAAAISRLDEVGNRSEYIRRLVREDMR